MMQYPNYKREAIRNRTARMESARREWRDGLKSFIGMALLVLVFPAVSLGLLFYLIDSSIKANPIFSRSSITSQAFPK